jgi:hypothetical protein
MESLVGDTQKEEHMGRRASLSDLKTCHSHSFVQVDESKPGARAMPPLTGEASRFAPRATGFCIDERISHPGRSRSLKSGLPCQGSGLAASLAPCSGLQGTLFNRLTEPQAPRMLDEPSAPFPPHRVGRVRSILLPFVCIEKTHWEEKG